MVYGYINLSVLSDCQCMLHLSCRAILAGSVHTSTHFYFNVLDFATTVHVMSNSSEWYAVSSVSQLGDRTKTMGINDGHGGCNQGPSAVWAHVRNCGATIPMKGLLWHFGAPILQRYPGYPWQIRCSHPPCQRLHGKGILSTDTGAVCSRQHRRQQHQSDW